MPHIELDALWHDPDWQNPDREEFRRRVSAAIGGDAWIVDGNYRHIRDLVYAKCDTILFLDYPLPLILKRLGGRIMRRGIFKEELWNGNRESLWRHFFTRECLFLWVLQTYRRRRADCREVMTRTDLAHIERHAFRRPKELLEWLVQSGDPTAVVDVDP